MTSDQSLNWRYPGARWWKFDFHTHTPASEDYGKGPQHATLQQLKPREWLLGFMRAEVDCVAITDHNSGEWIDPLKEALIELQQEQHGDYRPLYLFPGVEVTANGGTHVISIFDSNKASADIASLLGAVGYQGARGASNVAAGASPIEVVEAIVQSGGIPILAHVDGPSGAWNLPGNSLGPLLDISGLFAMELVDSGTERPELYRQRKLAWAEVLGSDCHHPTGKKGAHFPGSHYTWVKMAKPSLEGLRLALLDGKRFSIRRSDDPEPFDPFKLPENFVETIEIHDAKYMGRGERAKLQFSPWLSALVGGRGTGKSTVIHALRIGLRREAELRNFGEASEPRSTFERFNRIPADRSDQGGLTNQTQVIWTMMRDGVRHRVQWQKSDDGISVEEQSSAGKWEQSLSQIVGPERFPIRIFSQGQIAALAGDNQEALLQVIDDAAGVAAHQRALKEAREAFYALRARIRELDGKLAGKDALVVQQQDVERKLNRFGGELRHKTILASYQLFTRQQAEITRQFNAVRAATRRIEETVAVLQPEDVPEGLFNTNSDEDREVSGILEALSDALGTTSSALKQSRIKLWIAINKQHTAWTSGVWQTARDQAVKNYDELVEVMRAEGVADSRVYGRLVQERQRLDDEIKQFESMQEERARLEKESESQLNSIRGARRAVSAARDGFLRGALAQNSFVRIQSRRYGDDPQVIERSLRETLGVLDDRFQSDILVMEDDKPVNGIVADLIAALPENSEERSAVIERRIDRFRENIKAACSGKGQFGGHFNNHLKTAFKRTPELLDKLLAWFPEDGLMVEYSRRGDGMNFRPITQASKGQRSAAMLAFLLAHGEEPLVLDQPEDDLDNHLIYDLVVRQIRENKIRRQIIVVTHNPNIVVNGDAEMLHALDFRGGQCRVERAGSLQEELIREEVCRVMEGGREAFKRRYRRLGPEPTHV